MVKHRTPSWLQEIPETTRDQKINALLKEFYHLDPVRDVNRKEEILNGLAKLGYV